jgi:thiol-disulfide isomerase/thioredoxin
MSSRQSTSAILTVAAAILIVCLFFVYHAARAKTLAAVPAANKAVQNSPSETAQPSQPQDDTGPVVLKCAEDPDVVPPFVEHDLSGGMVSTAALKGKVVILNFWATWCGPCREEIPEMIALQSRYKDDLQIIGISEDDGPPDPVAKFVQKAGINYPVIMSNDALEKEYGGIAALPTSFLVNKDGRVVQKDVGVYPLDYYDLQVRALMGLPVNAKIETFKDEGEIFLKNADRASQLPGVSFAGLTDAQKKLALHRMNARMCTCGCQLTLAECRINDTTCPVSASMAKKIVNALLHSAPRTPSGVKSGAAR